MKTSISIAFLTLTTLGYSQSDLVVGSNYQFNIQRKNGHADAFLLHNAPFHSEFDLFSWNTTHSNFGSRGVRFSYSSHSGIHFYADNQSTTAGATFTSIARFFIGNHGKVGIATTSPQWQLDVNGPIAVRTQAVVDCSSNQIAIGDISSLDGLKDKLSFYAHDAKRVTIDENGNVGIGTASPKQRLTVNGTIYGKEVKVGLSVPAPDNVFREDYNLPSIQEIVEYIDENEHLPEVPSAKEMEANGIELGAMNMLVLKNLEEQTLYVIKLEQDNQRQDQLIQQLQNRK